MFETSMEVNIWLPNWFSPERSEYWVYNEYEERKVYHNKMEDAFYKMFDKYGLKEIDGGWDWYATFALEEGDNYQDQIDELKRRLKNFFKRYKEWKQTEEDGE